MSSRLRLGRPAAAGVARLGLRLLVAVLFLLPLLWMTSAAFYRPGVPLPTTLRLLPEQPTTDNFARLWQLLPLGRYTLNSLLVVALGVPLTLLTGSWAGLGMARLPRRSQRRWVVLSLAVLMAPGIALWSTRFLIYRSLGWYDTVLALVAPAWMGTSPFFVLMFYRAFRRIPQAIYDQARLDGSGVLQLWWRVALPMARPTVLGVALLSFIFYWGDFISPLLYLNSESGYTLPVALQLLEQMTRADWALLMAAAVWTTAIPVLLFLLLQPYFARIGR
ncbi:MAG TPA: carbohydrate ABC transporter permease [Candidatus Sulfomarinibacteraceae bacterium]|nr:carbohydrate ABC transporter permease [Candidatus Sulfomarinibacteraceae bacterium]